jgi:hypothetical protein
MNVLPPPRFGSCSHQGNRRHDTIERLQPEKYSYHGAQFHNSALNQAQNSSSTTFHATSWKVMSSITHEVMGLRNSPNRSSHTTAVGSTWPLGEMSTTSPSSGIRGHLRFTASPPSVSRLSRKCGNLDISQAYGLPRPAARTAFFTFTICLGTCGTND